MQTLSRTLAGLPIELPKGNELQEALERPKKESSGESWSQRQTLGDSRRQKSAALSAAKRRRPLTPTAPDRSCGRMQSLYPARLVVSSRQEKRPPAQSQALQPGAACDTDFAEGCYVLPLPGGSGFSEGCSSAASATSSAALAARSFRLSR